MAVDGVSKDAAKTYSGLLAMSKWALILVAVVLIAMAVFLV